MWKTLRPIIIVLAVLIVIAVLLAVAHEVIEARVFRALTNQQGAEITIGARKGNLISGYELLDVTIRQTASRDDIPPSAFRTPRATIHWRLRPFRLTEIFWDEGGITFLADDSNEEEIRVGSGLLEADGGWLKGENVEIGPASWEGSASLEIRADGKELRGSINVDRLPSRFVRLIGTIPDNFHLPPEVIVSVDFEGPPGNVRATGSVSNPLTRETYRF